MLFVFMALSQTLVSNARASSEIDNWPENDAWLNIELISWDANQSIEWDSNGGLPDPQFRICIEADSVALDCIDTPTWDNQYSLTNVWNYSLDIPDDSNTLNITIECEDDDALNDDECDMNSAINDWKLYYEYNWSVNPVVEYTSSGNQNQTNTWKSAASTWTFKIGGFGDMDNDGIQDSQDICPGFDDSNDFDNDGSPDGCDEDDDGDGTLDGDDDCPDTPLGATVDWGCPMDSDEDGVYDGLDLCPESIGHAGVDSDGCDLDSDSDGIPDFDDSCPDTPIGEALVNGLNSLGCSSSQIDTDGDGVNDSIDICPNSIGLAGVDSDGCDLDSDSDGIPDFDDSCLETPSGYIVDNFGCIDEGDARNDFDNDGYVGSNDVCPYEGGVVNSVGCPVEFDDNSQDNSNDEGQTSTDTDDVSSSTDTNAGAVCFFAMLGIIGVVLFISKGSKKQEIRRVRTPTSGDRFSPVPGKMPLRQPNQQEMMQKINDERKYAQEQVIALQQQLSQSNQMSASQLSSLKLQMEEMQARIEESEKAKSELQEKLQEAGNNQTIVQNITYNIQDSAISGDIKATVNSNDGDNENL